MGTRERKVTAEDTAAAVRLQALWRQYKAENPGISQAIAAERAGMTQSAFSQFLKGSVPMRLTPVVKLAKFFGVAPEAIRPDVGQLTYSAQQATRLTARQPAPASDEAQDIARIYDKLSPQTREQVRELVYTLAIVDQKFPWLRRGRPKGESYSQFERRVEAHFSAQKAPKGK